MKLPGPTLGLGLGPMTWVALTALLWVMIAIVLASLAPVTYVPRIFHSSHVEHLAAFYLLTFVGAVAFSRLSLFKLVAMLCGFAFVLAAVRAFDPAHRAPSIEDLLCDVAGVWAAAAPMIAARLRRPRPMTENASPINGQGWPAVTPKGGE